MPNTHTIASEDYEREAWFGEGLTPYVASGGLPSVPAASRTMAAFACAGYVRGASGELVYTSQAAATVTLANTDGVHWLALHRDTSTAVASWTRRAGSHYLFRQVTNEPAAPSGGMLLAKITVAAGVITVVQDYRRPASYARAGVYDVTDALYGAVGDGATDNVTALQAAASALARGGTWYLPAGTYLCSDNLYFASSGICLQGAGLGASILKATTGVTTTRGLVSLGYTSSFSASSSTDVTLQDLTIDGNSLCRPVQGTTLTRALMRNVRCLNSLRAAAQFFSCIDLTVEYCRLETSQAADQYGDGLYIQSCTRPKILNNYVYDFKRIGIVTEGSGGATTIDAIITGNHVRYGHDSTAPEFNAGIWCEHTDNAVIANNIVEDLTHTPGAGTLSRGINCAGSSDFASSYTVTGNLVKDCESSINLFMDADCTATVTGNTIQPGAVTVRYGIIVYSNARAVTITGNVFHDFTFKAGSGGTILIDGTGGTISRVTIADNVIGTNVYTDSGAADFFLYAVGTAVTHLSLANLQDWRLYMNASPTNLHMSHCKFTFNSDVTPCIRASSRAFVSDCYFVQSGGTASTGIQLNASAYYHIARCQFDGVKSSLTNDSANTNYIFINDCFFNSACQLVLSAQARFYMDHCYFDTFPSTGAILANGVNRTLHMHVYNCVFAETHDYTPLVLSSFAVTILLLSNITRSTVITNLTSMTPAAGAYTVTAAAP